MSMYPTGYGSGVPRMENNKVVFSQPKPQKNIRVNPARMVQGSPRATVAPSKGVSQPDPYSAISDTYSSLLSRFQALQNQFNNMNSMPLPEPTPTATAAPIEDNAVTMARMYGGTNYMPLSVLYQTSMFPNAVRANTFQRAILGGV